MHARNLIPICAACLLAACTATQNTQAPSNPVPTNAAKAPMPPATAPQTKPKPRTPVRDSAHAASTSPSTPNILIGLASDAVDNLLGQPDLVRRDGPAEVRLYRDLEATCTFHVFLYASGAASRSSAVEYFEARNAEGRLVGNDITDCYNAMVRPAADS